MTMEQPFTIPKYAKIVYTTNTKFERFIAIGDTHGCFTDLQNLLQKLKINYDNDFVVLTGDFMDRGPEVFELCQFLFNNQNKIHTVLGNHDEKHVRYRKHLKLNISNPDYKIPTQFNPEQISDHVKLSDETVQWIADLPSMLVFQHTNITVIHAGFVPYQTRYLTETLTHTRFINKDTETPVCCKIRNGTYIQPLNSVIWTEYYKEPNRVIFGHEPVEEPTIKNNCYGIDTGCVFGNKLTAYVENMITSKEEFVSVKSSIDKPTNSCYTVKHD